ncbi:glycosyltransferase family 4 protein [Granulosicoccus sp. 3-233]|uniref:glycosyltransferase family 4 protein n=1 Tax=Granulosicoccus sp. 3-233 TaxID=3417969 RepID=UPI003D33CC7E
MRRSIDTLYFLIPGDIDTLTGGYRYDRRIIQGLRQLGRPVELITLGESFPFPDARDRAHAQACLAGLPDGALVLIDGLAGGVLAEPLSTQAGRLRLISLVHHPLALETGIDVDTARQLKQEESAALAQVDRIITTSETTALSLRDYRVPDTAIVTVCPGTDSAPLAAGSGTGTPRLLCVATLTQRKGHRVLLDALASLRDLPWNLVCAGSAERDTTVARALFAQTRALALQDRVRFPGEVDEKTLSALYHEADLFVLASFHEGYGMVLDEAIARGLPIVASDAGAMAATVPANAGLLCTAGDTQALAAALRLFLEHPETRSDLQTAAREARSRLRSWSQAAMEFNEALQW